MSLRLNKRKPRKLVPKYTPRAQNVERGLVNKTAELRQICERQPRAHMLDLGEHFEPGGHSLQTCLKCKKPPFPR